MPTPESATPVIGQHTVTSTLAARLIQQLHDRLGLLPNQASAHDVVHALSLAVRTPLIDGLINTQQRQQQQKPKRIYYLSMEFLIGQSLLNNLHALGLLAEAREAVAALGFDLDDLVQLEPDAALGNGGLGRLAACFIDSMATQNMAGIGCGIRYEYGLFRQEIIQGQQIEHPDNWHPEESPWLIERSTRHLIPIYGKVDVTEDLAGNYSPMWMDWKILIGVPFDLPIAGYGGETVNPLRLYAAQASNDFDMQIFNSGDYLRAVEAKIASENISKVLYPSDAFDAGRELRLVQEYFLVACTLRDIMQTFQDQQSDIHQLPQHVAIQLNDTHPALAVVELLRMLVDEHDIAWDEAWPLVIQTCAYTNHTLLPEALECWSLSLISHVLPRHAQLIAEIDRRFLLEVQSKWPNRDDLVSKMRIISDQQQVRMAHLAIVGSHSVNGVAALHSELVKTELVPEFAQLYPARFNNKTNGVTIRRWIHQANPSLSQLFADQLGPDWVRDYARVQQLDALADDHDMQAQIAHIKRANKIRLADQLYSQYRLTLDVDSIFDVQCKRIHEYKRQLLNVLHVIDLYLRIIEDGEQLASTRTHLFAGKAAPGYYTAKLIIHLINAVAAKIQRDPRCRDQLRMAFLPDYRVSMAEILIPAADVSEQISTAGMEASGTGNMKFAMNGALTIGTLDGANIEIREAVGEDYFYTFGNTVQQIRVLEQSGHDPLVFLQDPHLKRSVDALTSGLFDADPQTFMPLANILRSNQDRYFHLADFADYRATHQRITNDYAHPERWTKACIHNIARMQHFSSDRSIAEYATEIWHL